MNPNLNFRRIELLYPYYSTKEMTFANRIGLRNQKCFLQEKINGEFAVVTFFEGKFYFGDKIAIVGTLSETEINPDLVEFLKLAKNSNLFLFGFFEDSIRNFKAFSYFSRTARKIGFNKLISPLASSFWIKPCFEGKFEEVAIDTGKSFYVKFPLQELSFKLV